jgi:hypothetical protein
MSAAVSGNAYYYNILNFEYVSVKKYNNDDKKAWAVS